MIQELKADYVCSKNKDQMVQVSLNIKCIFSHDEIPRNNFLQYLCVSV